MIRELLRPEWEWEWEWEVEGEGEWEGEIRVHHQTLTSVGAER